MKIFFRSSKFNEYIILNIILFILLIQFIIAAHPCKGKGSLTDTTCFNDVIKFDHDKWRAGNGCTNLKGDLIIEFSLNPGESKERLFYGLKKNGRYYFPGEPVFIHIDDVVCQDCSDSKFKGRFESRNTFLSLKDDTAKSKQYLFSMSSYNSVTEIIDIEDNLTYYAWDSVKFWDLNRPIFSYEYSLVEIENSNIFFSAFIESAGSHSDGKEYSNTVTIKKFYFNSFDSRVITHNVNI